MKAIGKVIEIKGDFAVVEATRQSACSSCHDCEAKGACHAELIFGEQQQAVSVLAENKAGASAGDTVELESSTKYTLSIALIIFILPFAVTAIAYTIFRNIASVYNILPLVLIAFFCLAFFAISKIINKLIQNKNTTIIVGILEEKNLEAE